MAESSADGEDANRFLEQITKCEKEPQVDELFGQLFENIYSHQQEVSVKKGVSGRMDEVKKYIRENYTDPNLTLDCLGDVFGVSSGYLGRLFKKDTGISVSEYINEERLKKVLDDLENTNDSAKDIAERCGFVSGHNFYTYFHKKIGLTPQAYRDKSRDSMKKP